MSRVRMLWLLLAAACGDDRDAATVEEAVSGSQLKIEWYLYADGTRQPNPGMFYETRAHARCRPVPWIDGVDRCLPFADDALFVDENCETVIGRVGSIEKPTHYIAHQRVEGKDVASRLLVAGEEAAAPASYYEMIDGKCMGPLRAPPGQYRELVGELYADDLVQVRKVERAAPGLVVEWLEGGDGMRVPVGFRDPELDVPCVVAPDDEGGSRCIPDTSVIANPFAEARFADDSCQQPATLIQVEGETPPIHRALPPSRCATFHRLGPEISSAYRRDGDGACVRTPHAMTLRAFALGPALEVPKLVSEVEHDPQRRLQRIVIDTGTGRVPEPRLLDVATREPCHRIEAMGASWCVPDGAIATTTAYTTGCQLPIMITEIGPRSCGSRAFAITVGIDSEPRWHAVGDPVTEPLWQASATGCVPYVPAAGTLPHRVGPALPIQGFVSALTYGER